MPDPAQPKTRDYKYRNLTGSERCLSALGLLGVLGLIVVVATDAPNWLMFVAFAVILVGALGARARFELRMKRMR